MLVKGADEIRFPSDCHMPTNIVAAPRRRAATPPIRRHSRVRATRCTARSVPVQVPKRPCRTRCLNLFSVLQMGQPACRNDPVLPRVGRLVRSNGAQCRPTEPLTRLHAPVVPVTADRSRKMLRRVVTAVLLAATASCGTTFRRSPPPRNRCDMRLQARESDASQSDTPLTRAPQEFAGARASASRETCCPTETQ